MVKKLQNDLKKIVRFKQGEYNLGNEIDFFKNVDSNYRLVVYILLMKHLIAIKKEIDSNKKIKYERILDAINYLRILNIANKEFIKNEKNKS